MIFFNLKEDHSMIKTRRLKNVRANTKKYLQLDWLGGV